MRALILSGGGAKGAWQAGVLHYLLADKNYQYDIVCGVSVGALNAAMLCEYSTQENKEAAVRIWNKWATLETYKVYKKWWFGLMPPSLGVMLKGSAHSTKPLQEMVFKEIKPNALKTSGRELRVGAVSWGGFSPLTTFSQNDPDIQRAVLASSAIPLFFEDIKIGPFWWVDGGLREITPIKTAIDLGATHIDVVSCSSGHTPFGEVRPSSLEKIERIVSIFLNEVDSSDYDKAVLINELVKADAPIAKEKNWRVVTLKSMRPVGIDLGDSKDFSSKKNMRLLQEGRAMAEKNDW